MSFLIYFFVLLVSAASVLFGLDLMSSPLPNTPNVPIGRSVQVVSPPPAQQREMRAADERALTPVYPTVPGKPKIQAETSGAAPQEQAKLTPAPAPVATPTPAAPVSAPAPATSVAQAPQAQPAPVQPAPVQPTPAQQAPAMKQAKSEPAPATQPAPEAKAEVKPDVKAESVATMQPTPAAQPAPAQPTAQAAITEAKAEPAATEAKVEPAVTAQPAALHTPNSCNLQACGAAYQSFRASDCSYQPMSGPRRACTISGTATTASRASKPQETKPQATAREVTDKDDMREVERIVKRQPLQLTPSTRRSARNGELTEVERIVRRMTRNENADVAVQDGDGNVFIVRKNYR